LPVIAVGEIETFLDWNLVGKSDGRRCPGRSMNKRAHTPSATITAGTAKLPAPAVVQSTYPMKNLITCFCVAATILLAPAFTSTATAEPRERHPEIHEAIHALEKAKRHMEEAKHDFGGHRKEALEACERAIRQLHLALEADRR
jgi:hypothetical protein